MTIPEKVWLWISYSDNNKKVWTLSDDGEELGDGTWGGDDFYRGDYVEKLEAKLAKAVEALHFYADFYEAPNDGPWGVNSDDFGTKARAVLVELEKTE